LLEKGESLALFDALARTKKSKGDDVSENVKTKIVLSHVFRRREIEREVMTKLTSCKNEKEKNEKRKLAFFVSH